MEKCNFVAFMAVLIFLGAIPCHALSIPKENNGRIKTLNNNGWMNTSLDRYTLQFIEFAKGVKKLPVLEVGAAYGVATKEVLKNGGQIIANDIDHRHLELLAQTLDPDQKPSLTLLPGQFPEQFDLGEQKVGAILASRVLHFMTGEQLKKSAELMYKILVPRGRIFIIADSPYTKAWHKFIPIYEAKKAAGYKFPGLIAEPAAINEERSKHLPSTLHRLDPEVLSRIFKKAGFKIVECKFFNMSIYPKDMKLSGKECVALIAEK